MSLLERLESDDLEHKLVFPMENDGSRMFSFGGMSFDSSSENILQESGANNTKVPAPTVRKKMFIELRDSHSLCLDPRNGAYGASLSADRQNTFQISSESMDRESNHRLKHCVIGSDSFPSLKNELSKDNSKKEIQMFDVISGRGGKSNHHDGNKYYRKLVSERKSDYRSMSNCTKKAEVSKSIFYSIQSKGGRFLIDETTSGDPHWREMDVKEALRKISQALREDRNLKWTISDLV
jgi:hypothetical protein